MVIIEKNVNLKMEELDLKNKVAVITGGTAGIGFAIAEIFYKHNCNTVIIGRDIKKGNNAVEEIINRDGETGFFAHSEATCRATFIKCDVGLRADIKSACEKILNDFKRVDILVLNAGMEFTETIAEVDPEHWQRMLDVNISGAFYFLKYIADSMIQNKTGNVIILSSVAATTGAGGGIHYPVTKAALKGLMARINYELLPKGIRANIISPGMVDTPMLRRKYPDNDEVNAKLCEQVPMARIGTPGDIANLALFLASDLSTYICGQDILIDGGRLYYRRPPITPQKSKSSLDK
jgi:3-oxoacyl-[acyl-carrier protein] reductase